MHIPPSGTTQHVLHAWIAHIGSLCVGHIHLQQEAKKQIKFLDAWVHEITDVKVYIENYGIFVGNM